MICGGVVITTYKASKGRTEARQDRKEKLIYTTLHHTIACMYHGADQGTCDMLICRLPYNAVIHNLCM